MKVAWLCRLGADCGAPPLMENAYRGHNGTHFENVVNYNCTVDFRFPSRPGRIWLTGQISVNTFTESG